MDGVGDSRKPTVVIVGGGFGGVTLARRLEHALPRDWDLFLLSKTDLITYEPLLPEVVGATLLPGHVVVPLRHVLHRTRMRMVEVTRIDFEDQYVEYTTPIVDRVRYDHLVLAVGVDAHLAPVPGMDRYGLPVKTVGDALHLRNRVIRCLEEATLTYDEQRSRRLTTFIVAGGGFTGVETAGEVLDLLADAEPHFKRVSRNQCAVHIVHSREHLLPEVSVSLGRYAERLLRHRGMHVHLGARISQVDAGGVTLDDGRRIDACTTINTLGTRPHRFLTLLDCADSDGRLPAEPTLQVRGHDNVWAIGDCAAVIDKATGQRYPATAQIATQQAKLLARNLLHTIRGQPLEPFEYRSRGQLASIGHRKAVAEVYGLRLSGFPAWLLWRAFYLLGIPTLARKARLFLEWNWAMLFARDIGAMGFERSGSEGDEPHASAADRRQVSN